MKIHSDTGTKKQPENIGLAFRKENRRLKKKLEDLNRHNRTVQRELTSTQKLIHNIPSPVYLIQDERIIFINEAVTQQTGFAREEILGKAFSDFIHPDAVRGVKALYQKPIARQPFEDKGDTYLMSKGGGVSHCEIRAKKIKYGGKRAFLVTVHDLGERKEREKRSLQIQKTRAFARMALGLDQELRHYITLLEDHIQEVQGAGLEARKPLDISLGKIKGVKERAALVAQHLACLGRAEYPPSETALLNLKKVVKGAMEIARSEMEGASDPVADSLRLRTYLRALSPVCGHETEMEFAFLCIILNAAEAMPGGGEVYLTTEERSGFAHVYVQDHGMGIREDMREKIFDPFFTTKGGSHRGLGLSLANAIIARHGGEIDVMSQIRQGSIFMVRLPIARQISSSKNKTTKNWFQHSHILIMTDEGVISDLLCQLFVNKGATVSTASTVGEALGLLRKPSIHLMIIDAELLRTKAGRILPKIRERTGDRPIVLFNAQTKRMSPGALKKMGADLAIGRPLDMDRILHLVSGALQRRKTAG